MALTIVFLAPGHGFRLQPTDIYDIGLDVGVTDLQHPRLSPGLKWTRGCCIPRIYLCLEIANLRDSVSAYRAIAGSRDDTIGGKLIRTMLGYNLW